MSMNRMKSSRKGRQASSISIAAIKRAAETILKGTEEDCDPVRLVKESIRKCGWGGSRRAPLTVYVAATSRVIHIQPGAMPAHTALYSSTSAGKSWALRVALDHMPSEAYHVIEAGSKTVVIYEEGDSLRHRVLVFKEIDSIPRGEDSPAASALRNLLQDQYLHYRVTLRD